MNIIKMSFFVVVISLVSIVGIYFFTGNDMSVGAEVNLNETLYERYDRMIREWEDISGLTAEHAFSLNMSETKMQKTLIYMLNSRVDAEWKWNVYEITDERTDRLLEVMEERADEGRNYTHEGLYRQILRDWKNGNYANSINYHEEIRRLRGMISRSRATSLFSNEEAEEYKQQGFPLPQDMGDY